MVIQKLSYFFRSLKNLTQEKKCPNCGCQKLRVIDKKYFVTVLFKCEDCKLNFRFPVDSKELLDKFYQKKYLANYSEISEQITNLPSDKDLQEMMVNNFHGKRDYSVFVKALVKEANAKVIDFGCSWGYSVFQLKTAGYDAEGFELSKARGEFGKKINVKIYDRPELIRSNNQVVLSSHTIEHLLVVSDLIRFSQRKLDREGILICFCPNGSDEFRRRSKYLFHVNWGFLHPNYLDIEFAANTFRHNPYLIITSDWRYDLDVISSWNGRSQQISEKHDGEELLIIAKPNIQI